ncbi:MAG TPA: VOC family protein, partial [Bryobacteraceae bacterium]|nr:VOC family protein [Bryobacteraceae bacterium]
MPSVSSILETSLYVEDLERSTDFYQRLFGFKVLTSDDRLTALNVASRQVLLLFQKDKTDAIPTAGGLIPAHHGKGQLHLAFGIASEEIEPWKEWLKRNEVELESEVTWPRGGVSLYFRDPDGHLI